MSDLVKAKTATSASSCLGCLEGRPHDERRLITQGSTEKLSTAAFTMNTGCLNHLLCAELRLNSSLVFETFIFFCITITAFCHILH